MSTNLTPINWTKILNDQDINLQVLTKVAPTKGNIVYEYNPFYNYRILQNMYEYKNGLYSLADLWNNFKITLRCKIIPYILNEKGDEIELKNYDTSEFKLYRIEKVDDDTDFEENAKIINCAFKKGRNLDRILLEKALKEDKYKVFEHLSLSDQTNISDLWIKLDGKDLKLETNPILREAGELTDFITDELSFDLEHPVLILPQYSYDGSVNLILNDGKNSPKLINSRFSATGKNTYEVCDRKGNNDTNIYDLGELFTIDTSLYKLTESIAQLKLLDISYGGNLHVGNYHFYFKVADADGNESDFIAESGLVSVFLGSNSYFSVTTGQRDENSHKQVLFLLSNLDSSYSYVHVYYSRYSADADFNRTTEYKKINQKYLINNAQTANIIITGFEETENVSAEDINLQFNVVDSAYTSAICLNRLFMANVHKPDVPYMELLDLSLRILPYLNTEYYDGVVNHNYSFQSTSKGYIDPKYIYEKTGYWTNEIYRFGIVYIMPDNTLSPVFNIRGGCSITLKQDEDYLYSNIPVYDDDNKRIYISSNEENYQLILDDSNLKGICNFENVKGVVSFDNGAEDTNLIYSVNMTIPYEVKLELSKYVKGYFFVRQPRIPIVLAQGITVGINKESGTPTLPIKDGIVDEIANLDLSKTHVAVGNDENGKSSIDGIVYASEGFLSRYKFEFKEKKSNLWKKVGKIAGIVAGIVVAAAVSIITMLPEILAGAVILGITVANGVLASAAAILAIGAATVAASAVGTILVAAGQELGHSLQRWDTSVKGGRTKAYNRWNTEIPSGYEIKELDNSRQLTLDFEERVILTAAEENYIAGILCPDYEVDLAYFNSIFIGDKHLIEIARSLGININNGETVDNYFNNDNRHFYMPDYFDFPYTNSVTTEIVPLADDLRVAIIKDLKFRARAGEPETPYKYEAVGSSFRSSENKMSSVEDEETINNRKINSDIIRGSFGPFLGFYDKASTLPAATIVNIYTAGYDPANMENYFYQRACDNTTFYTISDRFILSADDSVKILGVPNESDTIHTVYRGDCYLCQFTHRINRNFQDPSSLFNDEVIEESNWKDHYDSRTQEELDLLNLGDINAILLGTWVTFKIRSSNNLNIRTQDLTHTSETAMTNHPRTYYPKDPMSVEGVYKVPESSIFNSGFKKLLSERFNFETPDVPWIKNWYGTRIMYSNLNISDSFLNGFRVFKGTNYRDYTREYGEITKLISLESSLLCVFEHGVALIPVNERAVAGEGPGGLAYINTQNVLPENPKILSDVYGSQWADSIIKVPGKFGDNTQYVYGVDTVAKKIWRTDGSTLTCISDNRVQEFLNNNITLSEFELTPKIGIRNVKTFYNAFKRDVLFTFYDNTYGFEEKVWNLCWNEILESFVTFYSWVPSVMENINNIPFSFNRNTTKWLAKLGTSHSNSSFADGVTLTNVVINNIKDDDKGYSNNYKIPYTYKTINGDDYTINLEVDKSSRKNLVGVLMLNNRIIPVLDLVPHIKYSLERDPYKNYEIFKINEIKVKCNEYLKLTETGNFRLPSDAMYKEIQSKYSGEIIFYGLYLQELPYKLMSEIYYRNIQGISKPDIPKNKKAYFDFSNKQTYFSKCINENLPVFKNKLGLRENLKYEDYLLGDQIVRLLNIKAKIEYLINNEGLDFDDEWYNIIAGYESGTSLIDAGYYQSTIAVIPQWNLQFLSTDFWRHGLAGIFDIADKIFPTYWYGEQHPFEFEFIIREDVGKHKIFNNLLIISNKAEPESFHYEIVGECYDFAKDKINMYIRLEATKELYQYNGSDITFDHKYGELTEKRRDVKTGLEFTDINPDPGYGYDKSTIFPLYYGRQDHINEIYDSYTRKEDANKDYSALAGAELILYNNLNEIRIRNNCEAVNIDNNNRLRGNMLYKEDIWDVQINPINFIQNNEPNWNESIIEGTGDSNLIPVEPNIFAIPDDVKNNRKTLDLDVKNSKTYGNRGLVVWEDKTRKEVKLKDKYLKVRVRYSGKDLAVIHAITTLYTISYS